MRAQQGGRLIEQVFCAFLGALPREDFIPYVADFYLQLENVKWTVIAGIVNETLVVSVRNLGYSKNAGEFARRFFGDIGSAGGHRAMAKAVVPMRAFQDKFALEDTGAISAKLQELVGQFLHDSPAIDKKREAVRT
jgi:nanoRNase/pAp phosphatase (c-di-AMP/oligoRNAs hydrolase)